MMLNTKTPIESVPAKYRDCNLLADITSGLCCRGLTEMFCMTNGICKFYKSKKDEKDKDESETYT